MSRNRGTAGSRLAATILLSAGAALTALPAAPQDAPAGPLPDPPAAATPSAPGTAAPLTPPRARKGFAIKITNPRSGDFRYGRSEIEAEVAAADPALVEKVEFQVDGRLVFIDTEPPYKCVFDFGTEPRSWVLTAVAFHKEGVKVQDSAILKKVVLNYTVEVNRVIVYAAARRKGDGGGFVLDLDKDDIVVEEDGVRQKIVDFYVETRPVTLAIIMDSSGSMQPVLPRVHTAAARFVDSLKTEDKALVIDFDEKVFLLQDLTADRDALRKAVSSTKALGGTALYDALYASYRKLRGIEGRKAVILLTDGEDTASKFSFKRIQDEAKVNDIIIYPIGLGTSVLDVDLRGVLKTLAHETGGRPFFPSNVEELEEAYALVAAELKSQYYLTYEPTNSNWDGRWRRITVRAASNRDDFEIRARAGYYAVKKAR
jgi:VWFA-related protein